MVKVRTISRSEADHGSGSLKGAGGGLTRMPRNPDPLLHPFERAREYSRALNATKLQRLFAKPFVAALDGHRDAPYAMTTVRQSLTQLACGSCDGELRLWDLVSQRTLWAAHAHDGFVRGLAVSPDGRTIVSCGNDKAIKLWPLDTARAMHTEELSAPASSSARALDTAAVHPLETMLGSNPFLDVSYHWSKDNLFASAGTSLQLWDPHRAEPLHDFTWGADSIRACSFNPVEQHVVASVASDRAVVLYDTRAETPIKKIIMEMASNDLAWNPMEAFNFTLANEDSNLYTFDMRKMDLARCVHEDHIGAVMSVDYSPTGREFVSGSYDRTVRIFHESSGHSREVYHNRRMQRVFCVQFTLDSRFVVSGSDDFQLRIWKARASEQLKTLLPRERRKRNYMQKLQKRFRHAPQIRRITRQRRLPKAIHNAKKRLHEIKTSRLRKQRHRQQHSKPGTHKPKPRRSAIPEAMEVVGCW